ncbi:MAG: acetyl-CoA carboxylase biotin carboxyl carrier protein [Brevinematia bacterium]
MVSIEEIKKIYKIFDSENISEVELRNDNTAIRMKIAKKAPEVKIATPQIQPVNVSEQNQTPKQTEPSIYEVKSKWIGYFTRINPKTGENYVKLRDVVKEGDIIGHVSVLGVLQDVKVEKGGKIKEILVEEGLAVEYGQPLMRIETNSK